MGASRRRFLVHASATGAVVASGALTAAAQGVRERSASAATLRRSRGGTLTSLDPHRLTSSLDAEMAAELFVALTTTNAAGEFVPGCAASWTQSSDGMQWTFRLRPDCRWSDGRKLAAADFVASFRRFMTPDSGATLAYRLDALKNGQLVREGKVPVDQLGVFAVDELTLRFDLERPETDFPKLVSVVYPIPPHVVAQRGRDWAKPEFLVTNGAYRVSRWAQNGGAELLANPNYWGANDVRAPAVRWVLGIDDTTRIRLFRSGELEVAVITDGTSLGIAKRDLGRQLRAVPAWGAGWVGVNTRRGALAQPDVRRALAMAVDRSALTQRVRQLDERPWERIVPAAVTEYGAPLAVGHEAWPMAQRMATARELLAKHKIDAKRRLPLRALFSANPVTQRTFLALGAMWRPLGVDVELVGLETRAYSIQLRAGDYDLQDYVPFATIQTVGTFISRFASDSFLNFMFYRNADVDRLIATAERQRDPAARLRLYRDVEAILLREYPVIPLYSAISHRLVAPSVVGWRDHTALATPTRYLALRTAGA
jgi:oligopeptide transport system substrate-binding protein